MTLNLNRQITLQTIKVLYMKLVSLKIINLLIFWVMLRIAMSIIRRMIKLDYVDSFLE